MVRIRETADGDIDMGHLESMLGAHQSSKQKLIGCFTAASNVTGKILDDVKITVMLHQFNALAFWDYATAGMCKGYFLLLGEYFIVYIIISK